MLTLKVEEMTCHHCADTITRALKELDAAARVEVRLDAGQVLIESRLAAPLLVAALEQAGYRAQPS